MVAIPIDIEAMQRLNGINMPDTSTPFSREQMARRFGDTPPSLDEIAAFDAAHGFGAYERCQGVERLARKGKFKIGTAGRIEVHTLERQGLPSRLAVAYCELLYGSTKAIKLTGPRGR